MKTVIICGEKINNINDFYDEISDKFGLENWGKNLDALNDILYGGFGIISKGEVINLIWENYNISKMNLGKNETILYWNKKIKDKTKLNEIIGKLEDGKLKYLIDIIIEIISKNKNIKLILN